MTAPGELPRLPAQPTDDKRHPPQTRVWVHHRGTWRPAVVVASAGPAVTVRYRYNDGGGTQVDTFTWADLAEDPRTVVDTYVG